MQKETTMVYRGRRDNKDVGGGVSHTFDQPVHQKDSSQRY